MTHVCEACGGLAQQVMIMGRMVWYHAGSVDTTARRCTTGPIQVNTVRSGEGPVMSDAESAYEAYRLAGIISSSHKAEWSELTDEQKTEWGHVLERIKKLVDP